MYTLPAKCSQRVDVQLYCLQDRHAVCPLDALANCAEPRDIGRRSDGSIVLTTFGVLQLKSYLIPLALGRIRLFPLRDASCCCFALAERLIAWFDELLHTVTRFPDLNSHSCRMLRTNAPCDIPCRTFRALDASRRVTVASIGQLARGPNSSERACSMACGNDADCVRFFGRRRFPSRRAR